MSAAPAGDLFDEILDFLASTPTPEQIVAFQPLEALQARVSHLLDKNRHDTITEEEKAELEEFLRLNRFMSRLKLRARLKLEKEMRS